MIPRKFKVDDDDGIHPDARGAADRFDGLLIVVVMFTAFAVALVALVGIAARHDQQRVEASK